MKWISFFGGTPSRGFLGILVAVGLWYGGLGERFFWTSWAAETKAPSPKPAEKPAEKADAPDMPADVPDLPPKPEQPKAEGSGPSKPEEKGVEAAPAKPSGESKAAPSGEKPVAEKAEPAEAEPPQKGKPTPPQKGEPTPPIKEKPSETPEAIEQWPLKEELRTRRMEVLKVLRGGTLSADQVKFLAEYYTDYALARWTHIDKRAEVRKYRDELLNELRQAEGPAHDQAIQLILPLLTKMAEGPHAPVARVNALLALGELNRVEPKPPKPPEPLPETQPILLRFLQNSDTPDVLRVAALVGLRRHAELGAVAESGKVQIADTLAKLAQQRSPSGRSAAAHAWLRTLAIEVLELLKTPGANGQVVLVLSDVLADTSNPPGVRVSAAQALGNLDYSQGFPGDLKKTLREMGQLALDTLNAELDAYAKEKKFQARRLQTYLIAVYNGLTRLNAAASRSPETTELHQKILRGVRDCLTTLEDPKLRDTEGKVREADMVKDLTKQKATLTEAVSTPSTAPAAPSEKTKT